MSLHNPSNLEPSPQQGCEQRIIRQILEALLFEQCIQYSEQNGTLTFELAEYRYKVKGYTAAFDRVRLCPHTQVVRAAPCQTNFLPVSLNALLADLPCAATERATLIKELQQTLVFSAWNASHLPTPSCRRNELNLPELEAALHEGHTYHPCFKARAGFTLDDHKKYGPELANQFDLVWLAIARPLLQFHGPGDILQHQALISPHGQSALKKALSQSGLSDSEYGILPVHPWQFRHLQSLLIPLLSRQDAVQLHVRCDTFQAGMSLRTLMNKTAMHTAIPLADIKLPLTVVNTSSCRTICPHSIAAAPALAAWLEHTVQTDAFLQQATMQIQTEFAGITLAAAELRQRNYDAALLPQLNCLFRSRKSSKPSSHHAVFAAALSLTEPDGKPFIDPWIERYGCENWLRQLADKLLLPIWHLLVHHGIAVEAHGQNLALLHENGWPTGVLLKDFHESLEFVEDFVAHKAHLPTLDRISEVYSTAPLGRYYQMAHSDDLLELFTDTVLVYLLSDVSYLFNEYYHFAETRFWQLIYQSLTTYNNSEHTARYRIDRLNLFRPRLKVESLLTRKLYGHKEDRCHHFVSNPLYQAQHMGNL